MYGNGITQHIFHLAHQGHMVTLHANESKEFQDSGQTNRETQERAEQQAETNF